MLCNWVRRECRIRNGEVGGFLGDNPISLEAQGGAPHRVHMFSGPTLEERLPTVMQQLINSLYKILLWGLEIA